MSYNKNIVGAVQFFKGEALKFGEGQFQSKALVLRRIASRVRDEFAEGYAGYSTSVFAYVCTKDEYCRCLEEMEGIIKYSEYKEDFFGSLMTVEKFLSNGHKFSVWDEIYGRTHKKATITSAMQARLLNAGSLAAKEMHVLKAKALEKNIKTSYENCNFTDAWKAVKGFEEAGGYIVKSADGFRPADVYNVAGNYENLYRKVEKKWYEDIPECGILCWVDDSCEIPSNINDADLIKGFNNSGRFIANDCYWIYATPLTKREINQLLTNAPE